MRPNIQFMDGAGGDDEISLLLAGDLQSGNHDFTRIFTLGRDGMWGHWNFDAVAVSIALLCQDQAPERRYFCLGRNGEVFCAQSGEDPWVETIATAGTGARRRGVLKRIRNIGGQIHACGAGGQVYRRDGRDVWTAIDKAPVTSHKAGHGILCDIGGFAGDDLYVVGQKGRIFNYDGRAWHDVSPGTNAYLESLRCGEDGQVYVGGQNGTLLAGDRNGWRVLVEPDDVEDIWDVEWFDGTLYVVADNRLMQVDGHALNAVETGLSPMPDAYRLSVSNGLLWSIGESDICCFDGTRWRHVVHPDNQP